MTASRFFLCFCLSFVGGIFLNSFFEISQAVLLGFLILGIFFISVFRGRWNFAVIGFCILFLVLGIWRHEMAEMRVINSELQNYNDKKEIVSLIGTVSGEPDIRHNHIKLTVGKISFIGNETKKITGKILITTERYPEYQYGDQLKITGYLQAPQIFDEFNYKNYLAKDGIYSIVYYPEIDLVEEARGNFVYTGILDFKNKLRNVIYQNLSPPQSSFLGAMILGDKRQISDEWKEKLNYAGVRHLTAISGMHVAILTVILMNFLISLGFWRHQAFYFTIILITFFIMMTGFQPSAIRAGIMGGLFLLAQHLGRMNVSARAIVFAASLMLAFNPLLLKLDVGFQLSFLAILGIIYFLPLLQNFLKNFPDFFRLKNVFAMAISAQIFTLPLLIYNFGYFSAVAPASNILVVPFLPFIMGLGFFFVLVGTVSGFLGWFFSLPVWLLLFYLTKIIDWFSGFSFSVYFLEISWAWLLVCYLVIVLVVWRLNKRQELKFLKY